MGFGAAYRVKVAVFENLDPRQKNCYVSVAVDIFLPPAGATTAHPDEQRVPGVTYIAPVDNPAFLGAAPADEIAAHILRSAGPSGANADYLLELATALDELGAQDDHVRDLAKRVTALSRSRPSPGA